MPEPVDPTKLEKGDEVWCISKSRESLSYYPNFKYRSPWKVRCFEIYENYGGKRAKLASIVSEDQIDYGAHPGPDGVDADSNAMVTVSMSSGYKPGSMGGRSPFLFESEEEAEEAYREYKKRHADNLREKAESIDPTR